MAYQTRAVYQFTSMVAGAGRGTAETNVASSCRAGSEEAAAMPCANIVERTRLGAVGRSLVVIDGTGAVVMGND
jgi:hypothetical protein